MTTTVDSLEYKLDEESLPSTYLQLPLNRIVESPKNPRKHFNAARLTELVASITQHGVLEPVVVRPTVVDDRSVYELAAGHRRCRAARMARLHSVPAIMRAMSDGEFLEMLTISNLQREDVSPIEEAEGYRVLLAEGGYDVTSLSLKIGKSESYVYGRLKLLELSAAVREALARDLISLAHATELGKVDHAAQAEALRDVFNLNPKKLEAAASSDVSSPETPIPASANDKTESDAFDDGEELADPDDEPEAKALDALRREARAEAPFMMQEYKGIPRINVAELQRHLVSTVYVQLARAPFDTVSADLLPVAGSCLTCPKRTGATAVLFPELEGEDMCLDRACYHAKSMAQIDRTVAKEEELHPGISVLRISSEYGKVPKGVLKKGLFKPAGPATSERPSKKAVIGVYIDGPARGTAVWIKVADELIDKAVAGKSVTAPKSAVSSSNHSHDWEAERREREAEQAKHEAGQVALRQAVFSAIDQAPLEHAAILSTVVALLYMQLSEWDVNHNAGLQSFWKELVPDFSKLRGTERDDAVVLAIQAAPAGTLQKLLVEMLVDFRGHSAKKPNEAVLYIAYQFDVEGLKVTEDAERAHTAALKQAEREAKPERAPTNDEGKAARASKRAKAVA